VGKGSWGGGGGGGERGPDANDSKQRVVFVLIPVPIIILFCIYFFIIKDRKRILHTFATKTVFPSDYRARNSTVIFT